METEHLILMEETGGKSNKRADPKTGTGVLIR